MIRFGIAILLCLFFAYTFAQNMENYHRMNRTSNSSKSIYELVQMRLTAARLARRFRNSTRYINEHTYAPKMKTSSYSKDEHHQMLFGRLKVLVTISSLVLLLMIIIVILCILKRYFQDKNYRPTERVEERKRTTQYSRVTSNNKNFSRKQRTLPTTV